VISYPTRSLGGAGKGMPAHYRAQFEALADGFEEVRELSYPQELVFVARMRAPADNAGATLQPYTARSAHEAPL